SVPLDEVWPYVNPAMLYNKHLGFKGKWETELARGDEKARSLVATIDALKDEARAGLMKGRAVYRFFEAASEGNALHLFEPGSREPVARFDFPRQAGDDGLALSDYVRPIGHAPRDTVALFVTTA